MKIRMQGNSMRLRLTQSEVNSLEESGRVEERVNFGPSTLTYALEKMTSGLISARFADNCITVFLSEAKAKEWASTDRTGFENIAPTEHGESLRILVEKDFKCITPRPGEDESDNFENPNGAC